MLVRARGSEGLQGLQGYDPRRDRGAEVLGEKRPQGNIFPFLNVAGAPIIDKDHAEDVLLRSIYRNGPAQRVAWTNEESHFQLEIHIAAGPKRRRLRVIGLGLPYR